MAFILPVSDLSLLAFFFALVLVHTYVACPVLRRLSLALEGWLYICMIGSCGGIVDLFGSRGLVCLAFLSIG